MLCCSGACRRASLRLVRRVPLRVVIRGRFGRRFGVGLGTISGIVSSAILASFPVSFRLGTKHHIERCFKHRPGADSDAIWAQTRAPSGCRCGRRFGRSLGHSVGAVSGAISALARAPFGRGIERHSGAASNAHHGAIYIAPHATTFYPIDTRNAIPRSATTPANRSIAKCNSTDPHRVDDDGGWEPPWLPLRTRCGVRH